MRTRRSTCLMAILVALVVVACDGGGEADPSQEWTLNLPDAVSIPEWSFERDVQGFATDRDAATSRRRSCMRDNTEDGQDLSESETRLVSMLCDNAAGTGYAPGYRPDEAAALNNQARETTQCLRDADWEVPDPIYEEFGHFLRFDAAAAIMNVPDDEAAAALYGEDIGRCVETHAINWEIWRREHPR